MFKWIKDWLFPPMTPKQKQLADKIKENEAHGVRMVITERGGWRLEFDNDEAYRWYFNKATKGFDDFKSK